MISGVDSVNATRTQLVGVVDTRAHKRTVCFFFIPSVYVFVCLCTLTCLVDIAVLLARCATYTCKLWQYEKIRWIILSRKGKSRLRWAAERIWSRSKSVKSIQKCFQFVHWLIFYTNRYFQIQLIIKNFNFKLAALKLTAGLPSVPKA